MERFCLKNLPDVEVTEHPQVNILNRLAALENVVDDDVDINRAWENNRENTKDSDTESKLL
jgi:hypothetical protein